MVVVPKNGAKMHDVPHVTGSFRFLFFSELDNRPVCAGKITDRIGKVSDLVFRLAEPYPEAVGIFIEHGWGKPTEFVPWEKVLRIEDDAIFVKPADGGSYPPFVDQAGWILLDAHLMGRTILDMDGRRTEVVNDVHLLESRGRMLVVHVDLSFNGFLRRWGLGRLHLFKDQLISWKFVQPLSLEDAAVTDRLSLSVTRRQMRELPSEDLADALEELSGEEQQALFSALDSEKAAETLLEAEPRAQRQIIANLRQERARTILSEMSVPQLADLFTVLPHDDMSDLMGLLPKEQAERIRDILSDREVNARDLLVHEFVKTTKEATVGQTLEALKRSGREPEEISYVYVVEDDGRTICGVVDLRDLVLSADHKGLHEVMVSPVVAAEEEDLKEDIAELFAKYNYRMIPVTDEHDRILGVIRYKDIVKGLETRVKV